MFILRVALLYFLSIGIMTVTPIGVTNIVEDHGKVSIVGYKECVIETYDKTEQYSVNATLDLPGLYLGLIKWKCDNDEGFIVADIKCKECNFFCSYNEQFIKCKQTLTPIVVAFIISMIVTVILLAIIGWFGRGFINKAVKKIAVWYLTRNDRKRANRVRRLNKATGSKNPILFRFIASIDQDINEMIMNNRMKIRKEVSGDEPLYEAICHDGVEANKFSAELYKRVMETHKKRMAMVNRYRDRPLPVVPIIAATAVATQGLGVYACDKTLFLNNNGKICDSNNCILVNMYSIPIVTGAVICFNTVDGERLTIEIKDSYAVTKYNALYKTSSYKVSTESYYECKSLGGSCWSNGHCRTNYMHGRLEKKTSMPTGYGCISDTVGCDTYCWHQTSCTWYRWDLELYGQKSMVYFKSSSIWETAIKVTYKDASRIMILNTNNPSYNLNNADIHTITDMPVFITSMMYEIIAQTNAVLIKDDQAYEVEAAQADMPVKGMVGELQISLNELDTIYHTATLDCQTSTCRVTCTHDTPSFSRVGQNRGNEIGSMEHLTFSNDKTQLVRRKPILTAANLVIGSVELRELYIEHAFCELQVLQSYGCEACKQKPFFVIQSSKIKAPGILEVESNCTLTTNYLSCSEDLYTNTVEGSPKDCYIYIGSINQTIYLHFQYEYLGELHGMKAYQSENFMSAMTTMASSQSFWSTLLGSVSGMLIISMGTLVITRAIKILLLLRMQQVVDKEHP